MLFTRNILKSWLLVQGLMIAGCFNIINIIIVYHTIPFDIIMMLHYILVRSEYVYIIFIYWNKW